MGLGWPSESTHGTLNRLLTVLLAVVLVAAVGGVGYVALTPGASGEPSTAFYLLGPNGTAGGYPTDLTVGETATVTVGITNPDAERMRYTVVMVSEGEVRTERSVTVGGESTWEEEFAVRADRVGETRLELLLFRGPEAGSLESPYRELQLVLSVRGTTHRI